MSTLRRFPPLRPVVRNLVFAIPVLVAATAYSQLTVTVISPKSAASGGSPVFYEAFATNPQCSEGIAAMRIYSAPGVNAYTVNGAHLETFIQLAPGSYSTVVQAWDNCGDTAKTPIALTVAQKAGISVFLPNQSSAYWPVHVAASAENPACSAGISAIRIYTAPGVSPYTIDSNKLDAFVTVPPGSYNMTVQAWDNCGNVFKSSLAESVNSSSDAYLYGAASYYPQFGIAKLDISSNGTLSNPSGQTPLPLTEVQSSIGNIATDPGGWFVYASSATGIYGFQVNRSSGDLVAIPGSPFPLVKPLVNDEPPPTITMDPAGNFIYLAYTDGTLASYRIHRSAGNLSSTGWARSFGSVGECAGITGLTTNPTGQYIYISGEAPTGNYGNCTELVYGLQADPNHGFLNNSVPGSPYEITDILEQGSQPLSTSRYLYLIGNTGTQDNVQGFSISSATGALTSLTGSPFSFPNLFLNPPPSFFADWKTRFLWAFGSVPVVGSGSEKFNVQAFGINPSNGEVTLEGTTKGFHNEDTFDLAEDHTGEFVFTALDPFEGQSAPDVPTVNSWQITSNGTLTQLNSVTVSTTYGDAITSLAVATKNPQ